MRRTTIYLLLLFLSSNAQEVVFPAITKGEIKDVYFDTTIVDEYGSLVIIDPAQPKNWQKLTHPYKDAMLITHTTNRSPL